MTDRIRITPTELIVRRADGALMFNSAKRYMRATAGASLFPVVHGKTIDHQFSTWNGGAGIYWTISIRYNMAGYTVEATQAVLNVAGGGYSGAFVATVTNVTI